MVLFVFCYSLMSAFSLPQPATLPGLPLQMKWLDVDDDGDLDIVALMLESQTSANVETFFQDGQFLGAYEDQTTRNKSLVTYLYDGTQFQAQQAIPLGQRQVVGFAEGRYQKRSALHLWTAQGLHTYLWDSDRWQAVRTLETPGVLRESGIAGAGGFPFLLTRKQDSVWLVPDLNGLHLYYLREDTANQVDFVHYPDFASRADSDRRHYQVLKIRLPQLIDIDGGGGPELVFQHRDQFAARSLNTPVKHFRLRGRDGFLVDMNGDGLVDLVEKTDPDIDKRSDLEDAQSDVRIFMAEAPFQFAEEPTLQQKLTGFVMEPPEDDDLDIALADPFMDLNGDGLKDIAGISFKVSFWQLAKAATVGRLTIEFLLHLHVREGDRFRTLAGGPYEMEWKINIRNLKMPDLAQMAGDLDGDGWTDITMIKDDRLWVTPINAAGFQNERTRKERLPKAFEKPDQVMLRDLNGDGRAEVILLKIDRNQTRVGFMEVTP